MRFSSNNNRRVLPNSGYKVMIGVIIAIAIALVMITLVVLPVVNKEVTTDKVVVGIESATGEMGVGSDLSRVFVKVTYSDGSFEEIAIADLVYEGLDIYSVGEQNVSLNFGGFEQTIVFDVKDIDCVITYKSSPEGGEIRGTKKQYIPMGGDTNTVEAVAYEGYVFEKWNDGYPYAVRTDKYVNKDAEYMAIFTKTKFRVVFYLPDGTVEAEQDIMSGSYITSPPNPEIEQRLKVYGYTFSNWNPNVDFKTYPIVTDQEFYPEYIKTSNDIELSIPRDYLGKAMGQTDAKAFYPYGKDNGGNPITADITATPYDGRVFSHWVITDSDGNDVIINRDNYTGEEVKVSEIGTNNVMINFSSNPLGNALYKLSFVPNEDVVGTIKIKAVFAYSESKISFINYLNDKEYNQEMAIDSFDFGTNIGTYGQVFDTYVDSIGLDSSVHDFIIDGPKPVIGMTFVGWYAEGQSEKVSDISTFSQPTRLVAKWDAQVYDVVFAYPDGEYVMKVKYQDTFATGEGSMMTDFGLYQDKGVPSLAPQKAHFIFKGWYNPITSTMVDDSTKVYAYNEYLLVDDSGEYVYEEFFEDNRIVLIPQLAEITHKLNVGINGTGVVNVTEVKGGNETIYHEDIKGVVHLGENSTYSLTFESPVGVELKKITLTNKTSGLVTFSTYEGQNINKIKVEIDSLDGDQDIIVDFGVKNYAVNFDVDDSLCDLYYDGSKVVDNLQGEKEIVVQYNASINVEIMTNGEYFIGDILINGVSIADKIPEKATMYKLSLSKINELIDVEISLISRDYLVEFNSALGEDTTPEDSITKFDFHNPSDKDSVVNGSYQYSSKNFYEITAPSNGYFINGISINGVEVDIFGGAYDTKFYSWKINGVDTEIEMVLIDEKYYYSYGEVTIDSTQYIYVEAVGEYRSYVYKKVGLFNYEQITDENIINQTKEELSIASRSIYNTIFDKDYRVTSLKMYLNVSRDIEINVNYAPIRYNVEVADSVDTNGTYTIDNEVVDYNGSAYVVAKPFNGFYLSSYSINGVVTEVTNADDGRQYSIKFENNIVEDKLIVFNFDVIKYNVSFTNDTIDFDIMVNGKLLNNAYQFTLDYRDSETFTIELLTADAKISSIVINGELQSDLLYKVNTFEINNIKKNYSISISAVEVVGGFSSKVTATEEALGGASMSASDNEVVVRAKAGNYIDSITLTGKKGDGTKVVEQLNYDINTPVVKFVAYMNTIMGTDAIADTFILPSSLQGDEIESIELSVICTPISYEVVVIESGVEKTKYNINHGSSREIEFRAPLNSKIKSFAINGDLVSFVSKNWTQIEDDYGKYNLVVTEKTIIEIEYELYSYNVYVIGKTSYGQSTVSVVRDENILLNVEKIIYGEELHISMESVLGYHISGLYINDILIEDLELSKDPNNNTKADYSYKGKLIGGSYAGATEDIYVKAEFAINKYSFTYGVVNESINFASDNNSGDIVSVSDGMYQIANMKNTYGGIEHGSNFYIGISPNISNGYYLKSVGVVYQAQGSATPLRKVITATADGVVRENGGIVYFRSLTEINDGVTANIELITLTFTKRELSINSIIQSSDITTGNLLLDYKNINNLESQVKVHDDNGALYTFNNNDGCFYSESMKKISLTFDGGAWVYKSGAEAYNFLFEYGLSYYVKVAPAVGYHREEFSINGVDNIVNINSQNTFISRFIQDIDIKVNYNINQYDIDFEIELKDEDLKTIEVDNLSDYVGVEFTKNGISYDFADLLVDDQKMYLSTNHFDVILINIKSIYATTGYYLHRLVINNANYSFELSSNTANDKFFVYGGSSGHTMTGSLNIVAEFRIEKHRLTTEVMYTESGVENESRNTFVAPINEITWGAETELKAKYASGYDIHSVTLVSVAGNIVNQNIPIISDPSLIETMVEPEIFVSQGQGEGYLFIRAVKNTMHFSIKFERKSFTLVYDMKGSEDINSIVSNINKNNINYPETIGAGVTPIGNSYRCIDVKYYDEVEATITPKNGYKISELFVTITKGVFENGDFTPTLDENGNEITTILSLFNLEGDTRYFSMHPDNVELPDYYIDSDVLITLNEVVKTYLVSNQINRVTVKNAPLNNSILTMGVEDDNGHLIKDNNGNEQLDQALTTTSDGQNYIVYHHGSIRYRYTSVEGYILDSLIVNGKVFDGFNESNIDNNYFSLKISQYSGSNNAKQYKYDLRLKVNDDLIFGNGESVGAGQKIIVIMQLRPIEYNVNISINGEQIESSLVDSKNVFSDDKTIDLITTNKVNHYNLLSILPQLREGYRVSSIKIKVKNSSGDYENFGYSISESQYESENLIYIINTYLKVTDILLKNLDIYIEYETAIKKYFTNTYLYAYESEKAPGEVGNVVEDKWTLNTIVKKANNDIINIEGQETLEYFSQITNTITTKQPYEVDVIEELIGFDNVGGMVSGGVWTAIKDDERGLNYEENNGVHTFSYSIDNLKNRIFRVTIREKVTIRIKVENPYRYNTNSTVGVGSMTYGYYPSIKAMVDGGVVENSHILKDNDYVDTYEFVAYVGNNLKLELFDGLSKADLGVFGIYARYLSNNADFYSYSNEGISSVTTKYGYEISKSEEFYLVAKEEVRVTYDKVTVGADVELSGGTILFNNNATEINNASYSRGKAGDKIIINVVPHENYVFTGFYVRQMDKDSSLESGQLKFKTGVAEWEKFGEDFFDRDVNGFRIKDITDKNGNANVYTYEIQLIANMELRFDFYRVYELEYSADFSDSHLTDVSGIVELKGNKISNSVVDYSLSYRYVSYGASFTLLAPDDYDREKYQFIGWYINDSSVYQLSLGYANDNMLENKFDVRNNYMEIVVGGIEVDKIEIKALFQPIITVGVTNELFYYDNNFYDTNEEHYNTWETDLVRSDYNAYSPYSGVSKLKSRLDLFNDEKMSVADNLSSDDKTLVNDMAGDDMAWNTLETVKNAGLSDTNDVYSQFAVYQTLLQAIDENLDVNYNSWKDSSISLIYMLTSTTVKFRAWQYYNWGTGSYEDIKYIYSDENGMTDSQGNVILYTCYDYNYKLDLSYVYDEVNMPNAISVEVEGERELRPLLVKPALTKTVKVNLEKASYTTRLSSYEEELNTEFGNSVSPQIADVDNSVYFKYTSDTRTEGEYDYGSKILINSYSRLDNGLPYYVDLLDNQSYRFVGWQLNWDINNNKQYRMIKQAGSLQEEKAGFALPLVYNQDDEQSNGEFLFRALYINQYKQTINSYNIAGGEQNYEIALKNGRFSIMNSPYLKEINFSFSTEAERTFASMDLGNFSENSLVIATDTQRKLIEKSDDFVQSSEHIKEFYIDAGCGYEYQLDFDREYITNNSVTNDGVVTKTDLNNYINNGRMESNFTYGYDAEFDEFYQAKLKTNDEDFVTLEGFGSILNDLHEITAVNNNQVIDIQYQSKAKLYFYNIMEGAGISVPEDLKDKTNESTYWDEDNDGIVLIGDINVDNIDHYDNYNYALMGVSDGLGIQSIKRTTYVYDDKGNTNTTLFNPILSEFRRCVVIDYSENYLPMERDTVLFGNPSISQTNELRYSQAVTGNGSEINPYKIYDEEQLKNIGLMFMYNNDSVNGIYYELSDDIALSTPESLSIPYDRRNNAWIPICFGGMNDDDEIVGFDGTLIGNNNAIRGLSLFAGTASDGAINNIVSKDNGKEPNNLFNDYDYTNGYGIFASINGGTIQDVTIGNSYIRINSLESASADYIGSKINNVGLLSAKIYNSNISNITFDEKQNMANGAFAEQTSLAHRIYINAIGSNNVGLLAGYVADSNISNVEINVGEYARASYGVYKYFGITLENAGNTGLLAGYITGSKTYETIIKNVSVEGSDNVLYRNNSITTKENDNIGGLIGVMGKYCVADNLSIDTSNFYMQLGSENSYNVGGLIGLSQGTLKNSSIHINGDKSTFKAKSYMEAMPTEVNLTKGTGGKVGGMIGYMKEGKLIDTTGLYLSPVTGLLRASGGAIGGLVGATYQGWIESIELDLSTNEYHLDLEAFRANGSFGGMVGILGNNSIINDSSVVSDDSQEGMVPTSWGTSYKYGGAIYVYDSIERDKVDRRNIPTFVNEDGVIPNYKNASYGAELDIGGMVGFSQGGIFNSFVKGTILTTKYHNEAFAEANKWLINMGGIAGRHDVTESGNSFSIGSYLYEEDAETPLGATNRIQSCYANDVMIRLPLYIQCDYNDANIKKDTVSEIEATGMGEAQTISVGGIVGNSKVVGEGVINHVYSTGFVPSIFVATFGDNTVGEASNNGWIHTGVVITKKSYAKTLGTYLDVNIGHITPAGTANYAWSEGLSVDALKNTSNNDWLSYETIINYSENNSSGKTDTRRANFKRFSIQSVSGAQGLLGEIDYRMGATLEVNSQSVTVQKVVAGGFVGSYGDNDGRLYKSDPTTARLLAYHNVGSEYNYDRQSWKWYAEGFTGGNLYSDFLDSGEIFESYLVRGQ